MDDLERIVQAASRGFAEGLLLQLRAALPSKPPARQRRPRASVPRRQLPLSPELERQINEQLVPPNPRSPMDDYESAVPTVEQLDAMFAGADPENESIQQLRRQMEMQRVAAAQTSSKPAAEPAAPSATWNGIPDR